VRQTIRKKPNPQSPNPQPYALFVNGKRYEQDEDDAAESTKFNEQDIDSILAARSTKIEDGKRGSNQMSMSTASFVPASAAGADVDYNDPDFWAKLMPAAVTHVSQVRPRVSTTSLALLL